MSPILPPPTYSGTVKLTTRCLSAPVLSSTDFYFSPLLVYLEIDTVLYNNNTHTGTMAAISHKKVVKAKKPAAAKKILPVKGSFKLLGPPKLPKKLIGLIFTIDTYYSVFVPVEQFIS